MKTLLALIVSACLCTFAMADDDENGVTLQDVASAIDTVADIVSTDDSTAGVQAEVASIAGCGNPDCNCANCDGNCNCGQGVTYGPIRQGPVTTVMQSRQRTVMRPETIVEQVPVHQQTAVRDVYRDVVETKTRTVPHVEYGTRQEVRTKTVMVPQQQQYTVNVPTRKMTSKQETYQVTRREKVGTERVAVPSSAPVAVSAPVVRVAPSPVQGFGTLATVPVQRVVVASRPVQGFGSGGGVSSAPAAPRTRLQFRLPVQRVEAPPVQVVAAAPRQPIFGGRRAARAAAAPVQGFGSQGR